MRHAKLSRRGCWLSLIGLCLGRAATGALGQSCKYDSIPATAPASRFTDKATTHAWGQAMKLADGASYAGKDDWRLSSLKELASLVEKACSRPAIDLEIFPATPAAAFWFSTPDGENADYARYIYFSDGHGAKSHKYRAGHVRLVREP